MDEEVSKTHNIEAIWQRHCDLSIIFETISLVESVEILESWPNEIRNSIYSLPKIPCGSAFSRSKQQIQRNQFLAALKDMSRLFQLVIEQEIKYEHRLSPHSNFYHQHMIVQKFIQSQLKRNLAQRGSHFFRL